MGRRPRFHAELLERHLGELFSAAQQAGEPDQPFCLLSGHAGIVATGAKGATVEVRPRSRVVEATRKWHGVCRELFLSRRAFAFPVVVSARGMISLQTLEVVDPRGTPRLAVVSRDDVVEPLTQTHRHEGGWLITRWVGRDREARYAWRPGPKRTRWATW